MGAFKIFTMIMVFGFGGISAYAHPPTLLDALRAGKIRCDSARSKKGLVLFSDAREYERVFFTVRDGGRFPHLDLEVIDWSGRAVQVETRYASACKINQSIVSCAYSYRGLDSGSFSFDLNSIRQPMYEGPYSGQPVIGYQSPRNERAVRFNNENSSLTCKYFL
jgi:hypothetical protein